MRKNMIRVIVLMPFILLSLLSSICFSANKMKELRFTTVVTSTHRNFLTAQEFANEMNAKTNGLVRITVYPGGTLNPPLETYNAILTGIADIGGAPVGYSPALMPLNKLFGDALRMMPNSSTAAKAWKASLDSLPEMNKEFDKMHLLWVYSTPSLALYTKNKAINSVDDVKGLIMRVPPGLEPVAEAWGVSPVSMPVSELYVALQKNVIQGLIAGPELLKTHRLVEQTHYLTPLFLTHGLSYIGINKKKWNSFSPEIKKIFEEVSHKTGLKHLIANDTAEKKIFEFADSRNVQINHLDTETLDHFHELAKPAFKKIAKDLEAKGIPAYKILDEVEEVVAKTSK